MMQAIIKKLGVLMIALSIVFISSCAQLEPPEEGYTSFVPPTEADMGEDIQIDGDTIINITNINTVDVDGELHAILVFNWTNISGQDRTSDQAYTFSLFQDGVQLQPSLEAVEDKDKLVTEIADGETLEDMEQGYILINDGPITVEILGRAETIFIDGVPQFDYPVTVVIPAE